jgi:predicted nuclease of predicted toxin-antitoxin system
MKLVADESVDRQIVDRLRVDGHQVWYVAEESPSITDEQVLRTARERVSALLTADKDFGELVYRLGVSVHGSAFTVHG